MKVEFEVWNQLAAGLFQCKVCGSIVPWQSDEDKLAKHAKKHNGIAFIKGEN